MPPISIVVPHQGNTQAFERTLVSVLQHRPANSEVIVPHNGYDDPYALTDEVAFVDVPQRASLGKCLETSVACATSNIIHLLTDGVEVTDGWCDWAAAHFQDPYVGAVSPVIVDSDDEETIINAGLKPDFFLRTRTIGRGARNLRKLRHLDPTGPTSSAAFYRRSALLQIDNLAELGRSTIDLQIALALAELGFESKLETDCRIRWDESSAAPVSALRHGREMQQTIWQFAGIDGILKSLLVTAGAITAELITAPVNPANVLRIGGRLLGTLEAGRAGNFRKMLEDAPGPQPGRPSESVLDIESARQNRQPNPAGQRRAA